MYAIRKGGTVQPDPNRSLTGFSSWLEKRRFVRYKEGAKHYSMSENKFRELADTAEAVHYFGKMVLVDTVKIDEFLLMC